MENLIRKDYEKVVNKYKQDELVKFNKYFLGASEGTSQKGNNYCFVQFLEINRFKKGEVLTISLLDGKLPEFVSELVAGDYVEIFVKFVSLNEVSLVDITKVVEPSRLVKRS